MSSSYCFLLVDGPDLAPHYLPQFRASRVLRVHAECGQGPLVALAVKTQRVNIAPYFSK